MTHMSLVATGWTMTSSMTVPPPFGEVMVMVRVMDAQGCPIPEFIFEEVKRNFNETYKRLQVVTMIARPARASR